MEISPSGVTPVCQAGNQLQLTCSSLSGIEHRWEFTVFPENATYAPRPITLLGVAASGIPPPLTFSSSMVTFSRLSTQGSLPLISRVVISPVSSELNGTVVNCFEGSISTDSVANPHQFGKTLIFCAININIIIIVFMIRLVNKQIPINYYQAKGLNS